MSYTTPYVPTRHAHVDKAATGINENSSKLTVITSLPLPTGQATVNTVFRSTVVMYPSRHAKPRTLRGWPACRWVAITLRFAGGL
eukprot:2775467-Pleurochrysis_carterae.AAC.3